MLRGIYIAVMFLHSSGETIAVLLMDLHNEGQLLREEQTDHPDVDIAVFIVRVRTREKKGEK